MLSEYVSLLNKCGRGSGGWSLRNHTSAGLNRGILVLPAFGEFVTILFLSTPAAAVQAEPVPGFRFCASPPSPACADRDEVYSNEVHVKTCQEAMGRFVSNAFAYRDCLQREIQRAMLETNAAIDRFKCSIAAKRRCSDQELRKKKKP